MSTFTKLFSGGSRTASPAHSHDLLLEEVVAGMPPLAPGHPLAALREQSELALSSAAGEWRDRLVAELSPGRLPELRAEVRAHTLVAEEMLRRGAKAEGAIDSASYVLHWSGAATRILVDALERGFSLGEGEALRTEVQAGMVAALDHPDWRVRHDAAGWLRCPA